MEEDDVPTLKSLKLIPAILVLVAITVSKIYKALSFIKELFLGVCVPGPFGLYCKCTKNYRGNRCEIRKVVDPSNNKRCEANTCYNGGEDSYSIDLITLLLFNRNVF